MSGATADIASIPPDFEYGVIWVSSQYGERPASALLAGDINLAKDWVSFVLGPLADDDLETARLRETLEVFLTIGSNYTVAADKLHVHPNTIKYLHNAQGRLRVTTNDGRIDVALALVPCSRLGAAVLTNDGT